MTTTYLILTSFLVAYWTRSGAAFSTPLQVDLVFPKNNTVYQPVYPFPFVFALHNFSLAWESRPAVYWSLSAIDTYVTFSVGIQDGYIGWNPYDTEPGWMRPPDEVLAMNTTGKPSYMIEHSQTRLPTTQLNQSIWILEYMISLHGPGAVNYNKFKSEQHIRFNTSINYGLMPDLETLGSCPASSYALNITIQSTDRGPNIGVWHKPPVPCAYKIQQQTINEISEEMVRISRCGNVAWPNGTGIGRQCKKQTNGTVSKRHALKSSFVTIGLSLTGLFITSCIF